MITVNMFYPTYLNEKFLGALSRSQLETHVRNADPSMVSAVSDWCNAIERSQAHAPYARCVLRSPAFHTGHAVLFTCAVMAEDFGTEDRHAKNPPTNSRNPQ